MLCVVQTDFFILCVCNKFFISISLYYYKNYVYMIENLNLNQHICDIYTFFSFHGLVCLVRLNQRKKAEKFKFSYSMYIQ